ncbi:armadillo-type protein [Bombardia bombarda]|uniref:Armadillo-type protein n=1 Tax=Bombardia bombarda TaxID=252184 RepID=A0AA39XJM4_9PEZI|nr:armadillo-type protein [Bombardia bombarda]
MARIQTPPILAHLRGARNHLELGAALRALKDEIIGHAQHKEKWVELGVLDHLVKIIQADRFAAAAAAAAATTRPTGKETARRSSSSSSGYSGQQQQLLQLLQTRDLTSDELVRLQSLQLLASFANGGPSFLSPIHAVGAIPVLLETILPKENAPQLVLTALQALRNITDATSLVASSGSGDQSILAGSLFAPRYLDALYAILTSPSTSGVVQQQKNLVACLISRLCRESTHQNALANASILDALATMLASFVVLRGEVVPRAEIIGDSEGLTDMIPDPAPQGANLAFVLEAISAIIADSRFRACMLLCSPAIMAVFPNAEFLTPAKETKAAWNTLEMSNLSSIRARNPGAIDCLLPIVPVTQSRSLSSQLAQFPPLGASLPREGLSPGGQSAAAKFSGWGTNWLDSAAPGGDTTEAGDPESPLIPWLIYLARSASGVERVMATSVVASLFKAGFANPEREATLSVLVVPLLCQLLKEHDKETAASAQGSAFVQPAVTEDWTILERTPGVLARLVADSEVLQQAAYDCGALKLVCKLLKDTYVPSPVQSAPRPWSPTPDRGMDRGDGPSTRQIGPPGQLPACAHKIRMRESALKLIAALLTFKEEYRKALVEQDIVPHIVESLSSWPKKPRSAKEKPKGDKGADLPDHPSGNSPYGNNPNSVIIAACHAIRILGRSVSILRTSLEDNGVAMPILRLLKHPDAEVQIASCGAVCNLVTEPSPMQEPLIQAGVVKILCEQAHSLNPGLRLNSMWALKHLVLAVSNDLKRQCLEELESGWLVRLICDDTEDDALHARAKLDRRIPDADEDDYDDDIDMESYEDDNRPWQWPAMYQPGPPRFEALRGQSPRMQRAESKLAALREAELNPTRKARNDDLAIQEQGLDFIRNLIGQPSPLSITEMVDLVFQELGQDRLFEILARKLRAKVLHPFTRRYSAGRDARVLYPQAKVIASVIYILVHMAASIPRHRQLVIAQTELLKLLGGHFNSKDIDVRRALCHLFNNLVWLDDSSDSVACAARQAELKKLGFLTKLEVLEQTDSELDIREKARGAVYQIKDGNR